MCKFHTQGPFNEVKFWRGSYEKPPSLTRPHSIRPYDKAGDAAATYRRTRKLMLAWYKQMAESGGTLHLFKGRL